MWEPHQQHLKSTMEMVQRQSARRILHDFSPTSSASALVTKRQLEKLQSRRTSDKVCRMYMTMNGLVDVNSAESLLGYRNCFPRGTDTNFKSPTSEYTCSYSLTSHQQSDSGTLSPRYPISRDSTCLLICTDGLDGRTCLITIRISDLFKTCF